MISRPSSACGRAADWMEVGAVKFRAERALRRGSMRPRDLKVGFSAGEGEGERDVDASSGAGIVVRT
jgi:hypothetical protein